MRIGGFSPASVLSFPFVQKGNILFAFKTVDILVSKYASSTYGATSSSTSALQIRRPQRHSCIVLRRDVLTGHDLWTNSCESVLSFLHRHIETHRERPFPSIRKFFKTLLFSGCLKCLPRSRSGQRINFPVFHTVAQILTDFNAGPEEHRFHANSFRLIAIL